LAADVALAAHFTLTDHVALARLPPLPGALTITTLTVAALTTRTLLSRPAGLGSAHALLSLRHAELLLLSLPVSALRPVALVPLLSRAPLLVAALAIATLSIAALSVSALAVSALSVFALTSLLGLAAAFAIAAFAAKTLLTLLPLPAILFVLPASPLALAALGLALPISSLL
jgi:hypothetical protein